MARPFPERRRAHAGGLPDFLLGDASKAEQKLGWKPRTTFKELIRIMTASDLELAAREQRAGAGPAVSRHG